MNLDINLSNKQLIVRKKVVSFIKNYAKFNNTAFEYEHLKAVLYNEKKFINDEELHLKMLYDSFCYLLNNYRNINDEILNNFFNLLKEYNLDLQIINNILTTINLSNFSFCLLNIYKITKRNTFVFLCLFELSLLLCNIPIIVLNMNKIAKFLVILDNNCIEQIEEFIIELIKDSKYQDKDYDKNLIPLDFNTLLSYLINNKNLLINEYKMKSLYIFGSYYLKTNRFDSDIDLYVIFSLDVPFIKKEKLVKEVKDVLFNHFRRFIDIEEIFEIPSNGYKVF